MWGKTEKLKNVLEVGIIPVIRATSPDEAMKIVEAIKKGGINIVEITMTVPGAIEVMESLAKKSNEGVLLGAGTVLDSETARTCILAGADFIVGPSFNSELVRLCRRYNKIVMPGATTPTEIVNAWEAGADIVKVFPAGQLGGPSYIRAIKAPLPQIILNSTGGVNLGNAADFIRAGASLISVGSALVDRKMVVEGRFDVLTEKAKQFIEEMKKARGGANV